MEYRIFIRDGRDAVPKRPAKSATAAYVLYYHFTFRTKWSKRAFRDDAAATNMAGILLEVCAAKGYTALGVAVMPEHVHLVVSLKPEVAPAQAAKYFKGVSARAFNRVLGVTGSLWSDGYSVEAVGKKNVYQVLSYVANQDERHGVIPG